MESEVIETPKGERFIRMGFMSEKLPVFKEIRGKDWILRGDKNDYPYKLIELFDRSGKHNAIITGVADMIRGGGFKIDGNAINPALSNWMENPNQFEEANDILEKVALDLKLQGGFFLQVVWSRDGSKIIEMYHLPYEQMCVNVDGTKFYKHDEWTRPHGIKFDDVKCFPAFNPLHAHRATQPQVFFYKQYRPGLRHYPLPDYIGGKMDIDTDIEISNFRNSAIKSGFMADTIVTFYNGIPNEDEQKVIKRKIDSEHTGTDNAGTWVLMFADKADQKPDILRLQASDLDKQYIEMKKDIGEEIFIAHRVTNPSIFGVMVPGQLGTRQDILESKELFYTDYVKPKVAAIERTFNYLLQWIVPAGSPKIIIEKANASDNAGATDNANSTVDTTVKTQMKSAQKSMEDILLLFENCGEPEQNYRIIKSKRLHFTNDIISLNEIQFASAIKIEINDVQAKVLSAIKENPQLNVAEIANIINENPELVNSALEYLSEGDVIKISDADGTIKITDKGLKTIKEQDIISTEIFVKYKYSGPEDDRNRPFCHRILQLKKIYTRAEIDNITDAAGYDVWTQRGGWYHTPAGINTPYCRHFWSQVLVKRKTR